MVLGFSRFNTINLSRPQRLFIIMPSSSKILRFRFVSLYVLFILRTRLITFIFLDLDSSFSTFCLQDEASNFLRSKRKTPLFEAYATLYCINRKLRTLKLDEQFQKQRGKLK
jgi:hypothetical protein